VAERDAELRLLRRRVALIVVVLPVAVAPPLWATFRLSAEVSGLMRTDRELQSLYAIRSSMRQARSSLFEFLATSDAAALGPYEAAVNAAWQELWRFKTLTAYNPVQVEGVTLLEHRLAELFRLQKELIAQRKAGEDAFKRRDKGVRRVVEDTLIAFEALIDTERRLLAQRATEIQSSIRILQLTAGFSLALFALGWWTLARLARKLSSS
jgi:CHASE3 domain sensor protein